MTTPHIDHIGIVVADLGEAIAKLRPLFGDPVRIKDLPEVGLRVAEFQAANVTIELLQYAGGDAEFAKRVMGERIGLNHISARVADVDRSIAELGAAGFVPMAGFPRAGAHGRVAFFEPDAITGLRFEVCQPDEPKGDGAAPDPEEEKPC
jgi:catechol 2,3-dioxygenase-like lactoylglutathione lyase family enzyme